MDNINGYILPFPCNMDEAKASEFYKLGCYNWESEEKYRPDTFAKIYVLDNSLYCELMCYEENPKAVHNKRDDKIWCDSCLEFFVKPVENREEYLNIETNSKGYFLCEFGKSKHDRVFVKKITFKKPVVKVSFGSNSNGNFWSVKIKLTKGFIASVYKIPVSEITFNSVKANFYKCGDECSIPHYISMFPVTTIPPGFHNPECFKEFIKPKGF